MPRLPEGACVRERPRGRENRCPRLPVGYSVSYSVGYSVVAPEIGRPIDFAVPRAGCPGDAGEHGQFVDLCLACNVAKFAFGERQLAAIDADQVAA